MNESAPELEPVSFSFSRATGATCIHSTRFMRVTAHARQPATDHENKQRGAGDFDARHALLVTDRQGRRMRLGRPLVAPVISQLKYTKQTEKAGGAGATAYRHRSTQDSATSPDCK